MKQNLQTLQSLAQRAHARTLVAAGLLASSALAHAQSTSPVDTLFDGVDFSGISAKVVAMGVIIVGIVVAFKGIDLVKRVIRKV